MSDILSQWQDAQHEIDGLSAALSEAKQQLKEATDAARVMSGRIDQYCADEEQLQTTICTLTAVLGKIREDCFDDSEWATIIDAAMENAK